VSGVLLVVLGVAVLVVGLWTTSLWLRGDWDGGGRGHPLFVVLTGGLVIGGGTGLFSAGGPDRTRRTRGDEIMDRARRAHEEAHRDAARRARRAACRSRLPRWLSRRASGE